MDKKIKIGASACLIGHKCRYNGEDAKDSYLVEKLNKYFKFIPYCPENLAFGTPRESIRLVSTEDRLIITSNVTGKDLTYKLQGVCNRLVEDIEKQELCGFIFKSKSPSCGMERVKIYNIDGQMLNKKGVGLFSKNVKEKFPLLPVEEERRLEDAWLRENFLMAVFAYNDVEQFIRVAKGMKELINFHSTYKYLIFSKSIRYYKELGNIVANKTNESFNSILGKYSVKFKEALTYKGSIAKTYNILLHIYGYLKNHISKEEKKELLNAIEEFKNGIIPLIAVLKMLEIYIRQFNTTYLINQKFFHPYPEELALRSDIRAYK